MLRFTFLGVPVLIEPWFWVTLVLLGHPMEIDTRSGLIRLVLFVLVGSFSILVHEFGHALVGRRLGGGHARIRLWAFGGLAYSEGGRFTRAQHFWRIAAGPGAGLALFLLVIAILAFSFGRADALSLTQAALFSKNLLLGEGTFEFFHRHPLLFSLTIDLLWINLGWSLINLVPVPPLDGGQIAGLFITPKKRVHQVAAVAAGIVVLLALLTQNTPLMILFGYLGWQNLQDAKRIRWQ